MQRKETVLTGFDKEARRQWSSMRIGFMVAVGLGVASGIGVGAAAWSGGAQGAQSLVHSRASAAVKRRSADAHVEAARRTIAKGSETVLLGDEHQVRVIGRCTTEGRAEVLVLPPKDGQMIVYSTDQTLGFRRSTSDDAMVGASPPGDRGDFNAFQSSPVRASLDGSFIVFNCTFEVSGIIASG